MPLTPRNPGDVARSADIDQFVQLLTGQMGDQPVTVGGTVTAQGGNLVAAPLPPAGAPTVTPIGATGSTTRAYLAVASRGTGQDAAPGGSTTITNSNATLSGTNYNTIAWNRVPGATRYIVLVSDSGGAYQQFATVTDPGGSATQASVNDQGQARSAYTVATQGPGGALSAAMAGAQARLTGARSSAGPPTTGTWQQYDIVEDSNGGLWWCSVAGSPGTWLPMANMRLRAIGAAMVGTPTVLANTFMFQAGSLVVTTDAGGNVNITYPMAFPNGVLIAHPSNGDSATGALLMAPVGGSQSASVMAVNVKVSNTGANFASSTCRVNWFAVGF